MADLFGRVTAALPARHYRDPLHLLLAQEEQTCKGCRHREVERSAELCRRPNSPYDMADRRCVHYEDRG